MNRLDRILAGLLWLLGVALVAVVVHLIAVFTLPKRLGNDPVSRLSALAKPGEMSLLPLARPGAEWAPFSDPAMAQGACLYDLTRGPVRVSGEIDADRMLTLSFRTPSGENFYSMTDRAAQHGRIDVLLLTSEQLEALEADSDDDDEPAQELRLIAPTIKGFVLVNALAAFPSETAEARQRVAAMTCAPEAPPD
ncbi:conserved hypothetical protein [Methylocella silvestris BL2]|uniref:DUF1254 domain-containing protein n=1 Tax=Methylocella silvestris (strain DSM 15510 / CIP 108128 / LMG 27833 / NCIMB 13906 / BL2) TaxID=395965 RepID=B8EK72_METSB|nr:hypothetical protein [Methylocella silvestris]ACK50612.1 conserved hypothetical protein [Methylocella silvestris BL2]